jgi:hypothetical protein
MTLLGCIHGSDAYSPRQKVSNSFLLESVDPDIVFVELCLERASVIELPAVIANEPFDLIWSIKLARAQGFNGSWQQYLNGGGKREICSIFACETWFGTSRRDESCS